MIGQPKAAIIASNGIKTRREDNLRSKTQSTDLYEDGCRVVRAVADPGFSRGGAWTLQGGREHAKFSRKLHEIERIWTPRGGRASLTPPLDPPMQSNRICVARRAPGPQTACSLSVQSLGSSRTQGVATQLATESAKHVCMDDDYFSNGSSGDFELIYNLMSWGKLLDLLSFCFSHFVSSLIFLFFSRTVVNSIAL